MTRRPPRSTLDRSSAASDVYKRQQAPTIPNPTPRQRVDRSSPFYPQVSHPEDRESHTAAACGWFKSFLPSSLHPEDRESHTAAACGSFKSFLPSSCPLYTSPSPRDRQKSRM